MAAPQPHREGRRKNTQRNDFRRNPQPPLERPVAVPEPPDDSGPWPDEEHDQPLPDDESRMWSFVFEDDMERD